MELRLGQIWLVAIYDIKEALRSRRALTIAVLYFIASMIAAYVFVKVLGEVERGLAIAGSTIKPMDLAKNGDFKKMMAFFGGSSVQIDYLTALPPLGLFVVGTMLITIPWFVVLTATDLIAGDVQQRTVRYVLLRTPRINFVIGKVLSQAVIIAATTLCALLPGTFYAMAQLKSFDPVATFRYLLEMVPALFSYALAFVGLAACASQLTSSAGRARMWGLVAFVFFWILGFRTPSTNGIWDMLAYLSPWQCRAYFFEPELHARLFGVGLSFGFALLFTALGFIYFQRRDV